MLASFILVSISAFAIFMFLRRFNEMFARYEKRAESKDYNEWLFERVLNSVLDALGRYLPVVFLVLFLSPFIVLAWPVILYHLAEERKKK